MHQTKARYKVNAISRFKLNALPYTNAKALEMEAINKQH